ncbi:hypothetical protein [Cohnella silvisoli]|uniref:Uncharacterized protein n=1 Tax=Cohnella silvisoli TaxID=2873699 RepID=A0ABV1L3T3_9BACL|nr:hypothetical protein [Cohnella silvisoli]MCD9026017.1 hypothetical protein [Cohnella silvisoli]
MKFEPQVPGVTKMLDSNSGEIVHLFEVMQKYGVKCSMEFKQDASLDPLCGITLQSVDLIEYFERQGGPDAVVVELGDLSLGFDLGIHSFYKEISDCQILICIASDHYSAWFNSDVISPEGIDEAKNYKEIHYGLDPKNIPSDIELTPQEAALITFIRSIEFEDVLDATFGIEHSIEKAKNMSHELHSEGRHYNARGFEERAEILEKLSELLGDANADYRAHINPDIEDTKQ